MSIRSWFALMLAALPALITGCGGTTIVEGDDCTSAPPSTFTMQQQWADAQAYRYSCNAKAENDWVECFEANPSNSQECNAKNQLDRDRCQYFTVLRLNKIPVRECGLEVFTLTSTFEPEESYSVVIDFESDFDDDGITDWDEIQMGYNPCTPNSFGSCFDDADLDYDVDGIPDGDDPAPRCNPDDPSGNEADCV